MYNVSNKMSHNSPALSINNVYGENKQSRHYLCTAHKGAVTLQRMIERMSSV